MGEKNDLRNEKKKERSKNLYSKNKIISLLNRPILEENDIREKYYCQQ